MDLEIKYGNWLGNKKSLIRNMKRSGKYRGYENEAARECMCISECVRVCVCVGKG